MLSYFLELLLIGVIGAVVGSGIICLIYVAVNFFKFVIMGWDR